MTLPTKPFPSILYHFLEGRPFVLLALQGVTFPEFAQAILVQAQGIFEGLQVELTLIGGLFYLKVSRSDLAAARVPYDG